MSEIKYQIVRSNDEALIQLIANWYLTEWSIPIETTIQRLSNFPASGFPFQVLMTVDDSPVATGGIYHHVALLDREPRFKRYSPWLALIYTQSQDRNKGYGKLLCEKIQNMAKEMGLHEIFLFTHTAESLYIRLGWQQLERIALNGKDIVVMKMGL
jgi:GNAT superfamily N-acetyltransferase